MERRHSLGISRLAALVAMGVVACGGAGERGDEASAPAVTVPSEPTAPAGWFASEFEGRYDAATGRLAFSPLGSSTPATKGFVAANAPGATFAFATTTAVNGPAAFAGGSCASGQLCASVSVESRTPRVINSVYVQFTYLTPGWTMLNTAAVPTGYPLDRSIGLYSYGNYEAYWGSGTGPTASANWIFQGPGGSFSFKVTVFGTFLRSNLAMPGTATTGVAGVDACSITGHAQLFPSGGYKAVKLVTLPFPFTYGDDRSGPNTSTYTRAWVSSQGALGFSTATTSAGPAAGFTGLPDSVNAPKSAIFPFWGNIMLRAPSGSVGGLCTATTGATPDRQFVVTWNDACLNLEAYGEAGPACDQSHLTFSAILHEGTDQVDFNYVQMDPDFDRAFSFPSSIELAQGVGALVGMQDITASVGKTQEFLWNTPGLPDVLDPSLYPASIAITQTPVNP